MNEPPRAFKIGAIIWALLIGGGLIVIAGSIILPSTKRSRINFDELRHHEEIQAEAATALTPLLSTSAPATQP